MSQPLNRVPRTPELQKRIDAYHAKVGQAFVNALNAGAMKDDRPDVPYISTMIDPSREKQMSLPFDRVPLPPGRTPEQQKAIEEFDRQFGQAFVKALNHGVMKDSST